MFKLKCATGSWRFFLKKISVKSLLRTSELPTACSLQISSSYPSLRTPPDLCWYKKDELEPLLPSGSQHLISELFQSPGLPTPLYRHLRVSCQSPASSTAADFKTFRMSLVFVPCSPRILRISVSCRTLLKAIKVHIVTLRLRCICLLSKEICAYKNETVIFMIYFCFVNALKITSMLWESLRQSL